MNSGNAARPRSTAAVVATRADPSPSGQSRPAKPWGWRRRGGALQRLGWRRIGAVLTWTVLALLIAALWAMLLLGDSLP